MEFLLQVSKNRECVSVYVRPSYRQIGEVLAERTTETKTNSERERNASLSSSGPNTRGLQLTGLQVYPHTPRMEPNHSTIHRGATAVNGSECRPVGMKSAALVKLLQNRGESIVP